MKPRCHVIPAQAGIQLFAGDNTDHSSRCGPLDSRLRGNDGVRILQVRDNDRYGSHGKQKDAAIVASGREALALNTGNDFCREFPKGWDAVVQK